MSEPRMSEADFQRRVIETAQLTGWKVCHQRPGTNQRGRWMTAIQGDRGAPDLVLARAGTVLLAELKVGRNKLSRDQEQWATALGSAFRLWKPEDWDDILKELE